MIDRSVKSHPVRKDSQSFGLFIFLFSLTLILRIPASNRSCLTVFCRLITPLALLFDMSPDRSGKVCNKCQDEPELTLGPTTTDSTAPLSLKPTLRLRMRTDVTNYHRLNN